MLGNFTFHNPTKLYFGEEALSNLSKELEHYGKKVMLVYVWGISREDKTELDIALCGLEQMEKWMRELGLAMNITDCGADESMLEGMADACPITESGYVTLTREDVIDVLRKSLK